MEEKGSLRKKIRKLKKLQTNSNKTKESDAVIEKIIATKAFKESKVVLAYWPMPDEVQISSFIETWCHGKTILLPVISGNDLILKAFSGLTSMRKNKLFQVLEPTGETYNHTESIDLIIVPGVAFDRKNNRLGRGKGFYDRLLKTSNAFKLGIGFSFQMLEHIPTEDHDIPLDLIITP